jgi:hypothetical protein
MLEAEDLSAASARLEAALHARQMERVFTLIAELTIALKPAIAAVNSLTRVANSEATQIGRDRLKGQPLKHLPCVLMIDDDPATIAVLNDVFQSGYEVLTATGGLAGFEHG